MVTSAPLPDRRRARTRSALIAAGERLFAGRSPDGVSIDEIVQAADVAKGSFYNHFADRDALVREIATTVRREAEAEVDAANEGVKDPARRLVRGICVFIAYALRRPRRAAALARLHAGATLVDSPLNAGLKADLEAGLKQRRFDAASLEAAMLLTIGAAQVAMMRALDASAGMSPRLAAGLCAHVLRGLGLPTGEAATIAAEAAETLIPAAAAAAKEDAR
jgi:AcrR family transcriptional regulator